MKSNAAHVKYSFVPFLWVDKWVEKAHWITIKKSEIVRCKNAITHNTYIYVNTFPDKDLNPTRVK